MTPSTFQRWLRVRDTARQSARRPAWRSLAAAFGWTCALASVGFLGACSTLPNRQTRAAVYDFGPGPAVTPATVSTRLVQVNGLPLLALAQVETSGGAIDNQAVLYRLAFANAQQLRPYAQARWSMPAAQLVHQRVREVLGLQRSVVGASDSAALTRLQGRLPLVLRLDLLEFSQVFSTPSDSVGLLRLRATLVENTLAGAQVRAQRRLEWRVPAATADAAGGVQALGAATDGAAGELASWLLEVEQGPPQLTP